MGLLSVILGGLLLLGVGLQWQEPVAAETAVSMPDEASRNGNALLCQYGVNAIVKSIDTVDLGALRAGWYLNYHAQSNPLRPNGVEYVLTIRLTQTGPDSYTYSLGSGSDDIQTVANGNPGAIWLIGNEPDRRDWQDDIEPQVYAKAYHDLYLAVKAADPTARLYAGTIVQPTPLRLQYLDLVLLNYLQRYDTTMPVDGWSIHNFILNEVSCDYDPGNCWGAEIPPGINAPYGEIISIDENDSITHFQERIIAFRQWMKARGYRDVPLTVSEYGVLMPEDFGFPPSRVNTYMSNTFQFMDTAVDPEIGYPYDNNRLVQTWSWYSTGNPADPYNGYLFEEAGSNWVLSAMGTHYGGYTAVLPEKLDFYPATVFADPAFSQGQPVTVTLKARVANSGNLAETTGPVVVRFYDGDPQSGGMQIGADQTVTLAGCGRVDVVELLWPNVPPGTHEVYVVVDEDGAFTEVNEGNNMASQTILVATERSFLPIIDRAFVAGP
jgi:hypothetical protein